MTASTSTTAQRYPSSLSQGQGGPSRRPSRHQLVYPSPSIDDEVPPAPTPAPMPFGDITRRSLNNLNGAKAYTAGKGQGGSKGGSSMTGKAPVTSSSAAGPDSTRSSTSTTTTTSAGTTKGLNPNSKPYMPKYQRSAPDLHHMHAAAAHTARGGVPMAPSSGYTNASMHSSFGNGTGTGQMYPDGTFVYPSIAPVSYPSMFGYDAAAYTLQHPTAGALSSGIPPPKGSEAKAKDRDRSGAPAKTEARQEYSSLQHLLEQAGYAETRVHTPPAERIRQLRQQRSFVASAGTPTASSKRAQRAQQGQGGGRRIMRTFEDVDQDEVRDLYSAFGMGYASESQAATGTIKAGDDIISGGDGQKAERETDSATSTGPKVICHITAPAIPVKSSTSVLRDVAMQDMAYQQAMSPPSSDAADTPGASSLSYSTRFGFGGGDHGYASFAAGVTLGVDEAITAGQQQQQHWWNGFGTSVLTRATQAVKDMSPTKEMTGFDFAFTSSAAGTGAGSVTSTCTSGTVGLGLARGGEGVKKAKSAFTLGRQSRAEYGGCTRDQEEMVPPSFAFTGYAQAPAQTGRDAFSDAPPTFSMPAAVALQSTPAPAAAPSQRLAERRGALALDTSLTSFAHHATGNVYEAEAEADLYSPLPADYEAQCEDDELFSTSFDVGSERSFASSDSASASASEQGMSPEQAFFVLPPLAFADADGAAENHDEEEAARVVPEGEEMGAASLASRIMRDAVDLDDVDDSPIKGNVALPAIEVEDASFDSILGGSQTPQRPMVVRASTSPSPASALSDAPAVFGSGLGLAPMSAQAETAAAAPATKVLKYGDRATKLRMARSTPAFSRSQASAAAPAPAPALPALPGNSGWLASIRSYLPTAYSARGVALPSTSIAVDPTETPAPVIPAAAAPYTPFRVTPALPAAPLAKAAAVLCDSTSDMAEDLPAIPMGMAMAMAAHAQDQADLGPKGTGASAAAALVRKISMGRVGDEAAAAGANAGADASATANADKGTAGQAFALRLRPSLAKMRSMVFGPPVSVDVPAVPALPVAYAKTTSEGEGALVPGGGGGQDGNTPMLSPRIDLAEGDAFAGWSPVKVQRGPRIGPQGEVYTPKKAVWAHHTVASSSSGVAAFSGEGSSAAEGAGEEDGYGSTIIDYTQSFFYKPCTPPAHLARRATDGAGEAEQNGDGEQEPAQASESASSSGQGQIAKRQRSIKSLRKALLIPVAPSAPPVPALPAHIASHKGKAAAASAAGSGFGSMNRHSRSAASTTIANFFTGSASASASASSSTSSLDSSAPTIPQLRTPPALPLDAPGGAGAGAGAGRMPEPPALAILSPGAWEAGLPPRALLLEEEDWEARRLAGDVSGDEGLGMGFGLVGKKGKGKKKGGKVRRKGSAKSIRAD